VTPDSRARFAEVVAAPDVDLALACLLVGAEARPDLDVAAGLATLDALAGEAIVDVAASAPAYDVAQGLRGALGDRAGFRGYGDDYGDLRASLLHEVLRRRRGLPILLSVVYMEVGRRLGVQVAGIGLPGHFVVGVGDVLLDPFHGGRLLSPGELSARVSEILGERLEVTPEHLRPWHPRDIVLRVLSNIRASSGRADQLRTRLWATELSLLVPGAPPVLRRELGELRARLGDYLGAATAIEAYASLIDPLDPAAAELARRQAKLARSRLS
jgi:regulator of sirC expression with transglutaminase-like and TPR domain